MKTHYFRANVNVLDAIRDALMIDLGQPNGSAGEPWPVGGIFNDGSFAYLAVGEHLPEILNGLIGAVGVEEIDEQAYFSALPQEEES